MKTKISLLLLLFMGSLYLHGQRVWQRIESLNDTYLYKVYATTPDTLFVTGQSLIAKSTDYGNTWHKTIIQENILIRNIIFVDKNTGFAVGDNGVIYKTVNGGITWNIKPTNVTANLNAIAYTSSEDIWVVGNAGTVLISNNSGETWERKDFSTEEDLNDIKFYDLEGYIVGKSLSLYKTINAGNNWDKEPTVIDENAFYSVQKTPNNLYVLAGDATRPYASYKKDNSGNWNILAGGTGLYMINDGIGYSLNAGILTNGGENIMILHTIENDADVNENTIFRSWTYCIDVNHSDISIVNDTMIYVLSGSVLLRSSPNMTTDIKKPIINKELTIFQSSTQRNELIVKSHLQPIIAIELFNISGNKILDKRMTIKLSETSIDISHIPVGVYLAKVAFENKRQIVCKWIKQ